MLIGKCKQFSRGEQLFWYLLIALRLGKKSCFFFNFSKPTTPKQYDNIYFVFTHLLPGETNAAHAKVLQSLGTNLIKHT